MKSAFRNFSELERNTAQSKKEPLADTVPEDYSQHIEKLMESIDDRMELTSRLAALIEEIGAEYKCREKKSFEDMQRLAEKEAGIRLLEKRIIRLTDHIKTYIDYFYTDPCPSDDPLTWGN